MSIRIWGLAILTLGTLLLPARLTGAAEAEPAPAAAEQPPGQPSDQQAADAERPAGGSGPSAEVFVPTEEISEDYAVSFPVDI